MMSWLSRRARDPLWRVKHRVIASLARRGVAHSLAVELETVLRTHAIDGVLDVGANRGQYARLVRRLGFRGAIWSFEPMPAVAEALRAEARRDDPAWFVEACALGAVARDATLHIAQDDVFSSLLNPTAFGERAFLGGPRTARVEQVPVRRLDAIPLQPTPQRIHLKIDTQGSELAVLQGAEGLRTTIVSIQVEVAFLPVYQGAPSGWDVLLLLHNWGFHLVALEGVGRERESRRLIDADALFVRSVEPSVS